MDGEGRMREEGRRVRGRVGGGGRMRVGRGDKGIK